MNKLIESIKKRKVSQHKTSDLIPYANNANLHSDEQVDLIAKTMERVGWTNPVLIRPDMTIVAGHGRILAAEKLGLEKVPCIVLDGLSEADYRAYALADNQLARLSVIDEGILALELAALENAKHDTSYLGFTDEQLVQFMAGGKAVEGNTDPDDVPEVEQNKFKVERGQIWQLGDHRMMCGDSTSKDDVAKLMGGEKADMVFTDPPYGYSYESNHQKKHKMLQNDDKVLNFMPLMVEFMEKNSCAYVCGSHQTIEKWKPIFCEAFNYKNMIVWKKNNWSMGDLKGAYAGQHELILFGHKGKVQLQGKRDTDVWSFDREPPKDHPTQKPVDMISFAIGKVLCNRVLDLFLGSGSTLIACEKTGRKCYGMEIDPHYCSVIIERWQNFTGRKAQKITASKTKLRPKQLEAAQ